MSSLFANNAGSILTSSSPTTDLIKFLATAGLANPFILLSGKFVIAENIVEFKGDISINLFKDR